MTRYLLIAAIAALAIDTPRPATANQAAMTRETFLATTWRLGGTMFAIQPLDGFPITFGADGSVATRNIRGYTRWSLRDDELVLSGNERTPVMRFQWLPDRRVFRHCPIPSKAPVFVLAESGRQPPNIGCDDVPAAVLKLQIALDKSAYEPGERIVATATLTNVGNAPIEVRRSADDTGRSDGFMVELTRNGANALDRVPRPAAGDPGQAELLAPGGTSSRTLVLTQMLGALKPGRYQLRILYTATYPDGHFGIWSGPVALEIVQRPLPSTGRFFALSCG